MLAHLRRSLILAIVALLLTFLYAFAGSGVAQLLFKHQADGSLTANGSTLIGQNWAFTPCAGHLPGSCVFQGRPDALGPYAVKATNPAGHGGDNPLMANGGGATPGPELPGGSGGTNLGPRSAELRTYTEELVAYWHQRGVNPTPDLVTTSASGYDPDITPQDAIAQVPMVSAATGLAPSALRTLITKETQGAELGFLGASYIDVLQLNEALRQLG